MKSRILHCFLVLICLGAIVSLICFVVLFNWVYKSYINGDLIVYIKTRIISVDNIGDIRDYFAGEAPVIIDSNLEGRTSYIYGLKDGLCSVEIINDRYSYSGNNSAISCFDLDENDIDILAGTSSYNRMDFLMKEVREYDELPSGLLSERERQLITLFHFVVAIILFDILVICGTLLFKHVKAN